MNVLRIYWIVTATISIVLGVGFMIAPQFMSRLSGIPCSLDVAMVERFFGTTTLGLGFAAWALQKTTDLFLTRKLLIAHYIHDIIGCYAAYDATISGSLNRAGWVVVLTYGALAIASIALYQKTTNSISVLQRQTGWQGIIK